jgi:hypothetical protein
MNPETFHNQTALRQYAEIHGLGYVWEGTKAFSKRIAMLALAQYEIVEVQTRRGITRALLFSRTIPLTEIAAEKPRPDALAAGRALRQSRRKSASCR